MPPPINPAPRPPSFSNTLISTLRSSASIQESHTRAHSAMQENNLEEIALHPMTSQKVVPLSIEPTSDQSAAIATVLIQMPKCTSEPRYKSNVSQTSESPEPSLLNINEDSPLMSTNRDGSVAGPTARKNRFKSDCDIIPVTVGGGNSQTISFGCVLVNTAQPAFLYKSKNPVRHHRKDPSIYQIIPRNTQ